MFSRRRRRLHPAPALPPARHAGCRQERILSTPRSIYVGGMPRRTRPICTGPAKSKTPQTRDTAEVDAQRKKWRGDACVPCCPSLRSTARAVPSMPDETDESKEADHDGRAVLRARMADVILNAAANAVVVCDRDGIICFWNPGAARIFDSGSGRLSVIRSISSFPTGFRPAIGKDSTR